MTELGPVFFAAFMASFVSTVLLVRHLLREEMK